MTVKEEDLSGRMYAKYGMSKMYKSGYTGWLKPCIFACSIHGDFEGVPKRVYEGRKNCPKCKIKEMSKNSSFRRSGLRQGVGVFDLDINLFDNVERYKKIETLWAGVLERCYSNNENFSAYSDCSVSDDWLYCSKFFEDIRGMKNYEKLYAGWHLDKDVMVKGNRIYSKQTCCIIPNEINCVFNKAKGIRGNYPIGVTYDKQRKSLVSYCHDNGKFNFLGYHKTEEDAFMAYKTFKEDLIVEKAKNYRELVGERVYNAMLNYKVEITD